MIKITTISEINSRDDQVEEILNMLEIPRGIYVRYLLKGTIRKYLSQLRDTLTVVVEDLYIDKVYRDEYYSYYSTKLEPYSRNCVKLSFLDYPINPGELFNESAARDKLKESYLGFMVLRPIFPGIIGRTAIDPKALNCGISDISICKAPIRTTVFGIGVEVNAFPHSSQDTEFMTCAETSIWTIMEYFGNKYPEYRPILPSEIHRILDTKAFKRHIPSEGLLYSDISYILQSQSFGCKVYTRSQYKGTEFNRIFATYVESAIPIAVAATGGGIGHAIVCVGKKNVEKNVIDKAVPQRFGDGKEYFYWNDALSEFVFNDDNNPCYQIANVNNPTPQYAACQISDIIVPLYRKIYLDAAKAISYTKIVCEKFLHITDGCVIRTYLASAHSYRNYLMKDELLYDGFKNFILDKINLPKFVWVTEISEKPNFLADKVDGLVLLDATEPNTYTFNPIIFACFCDENIFYDDKTLSFRKNGLTLRFQSKAFNNLKQ